MPNNVIRQKVNGDTRYKTGLEFSPLENHNARLGAQPQDLDSIDGLSSRCFSNLKHSVVVGPQTTLCKALDQGLRRKYQLV